ncbi:PucR family transcriptional regulator [Streptomonospora wellingtoniae]|uniref:Helix-turn-helix domain-containing protein n=1 Tax=Streptomonospora wellingtoniae TaxID=3075544 RepID=A0ABU2KQ88_9ACTN|nr:helix-turn-helix domain-containing protein [Streptomonospora sp. DSM 45055]MDT0301298.1 helix-turn-helix domain-containing protein [Streptomonospora sp. DSM 45055]
MWRGSIFFDLHDPFLLSSLLFDGRDEDEILRLALGAVDAFASLQPLAGYRMYAGSLRPLDDERWAPAAGLDAEVAELDGQDETVSSVGVPWVRAFALRHSDDVRGYLVVGSTAEPTEGQLLPLRFLVQQTAAAMANTETHRREQAVTARLRRLNEENERANARLSAHNAELEFRERLYEALVDTAAAGEGAGGIARTLGSFTGFPVVIENRFGDPIAWSDEDSPWVAEAATPQRREAAIEEAERLRRPVRDGSSLIALAQPRHEVLGVIVLVDSAHLSGGREIAALERGSLVLATELTHLRSFAEVELRLRRDLVEDLISGSDEVSAYSRAEAIGHDLRVPHRVVVIDRLRGDDDAALAAAVARVADEQELAPLLAKRGPNVVMLVGAGIDGAKFHDALDRQIGGVAVGVGAPCAEPESFPRSFWEAEHALDVRRNSRHSSGITTYETLGLYRILGARDAVGDVNAFVDEWLGTLARYDGAHSTELVRTLAHYLDCGGNYTLSSKGLRIHRSTLRYRLRRIREVSGFDLGDAEHRLNLHVATRIWRLHSDGAQ